MNHDPMADVLKQSWFASMFDVASVDRDMQELCSQWHYQVLNLYLHIITASVSQANLYHV